GSKPSPPPSSLPPPQPARTRAAAATADQVARTCRRAGAVRIVAPRFMVILWADRQGPKVKSLSHESSTVHHGCQYVANGVNIGGKPAAAIFQRACSRVASASSKTEILPFNRVCAARAGRASVARCPVEVVQEGCAGLASHGFSALDPRW